MASHSVPLPQNVDHDLTETANSTELYVLVTPNDLHLDPLVSMVSDDGAGAIATFSGVTRNTFDGKGVLRLEYEAYEPMAVKKMAVRNSPCPNEAMKSRHAVLPGATIPRVTGIVWASGQGKALISCDRGAGDL